METIVEQTDAITLAMDASAKPVETLRYLVQTDSRLADALALADDHFDGWNASQLVHEVAVALGIVAAALKSHSLSRPFPMQRARAAKIEAEEEAVSF